MTNIKTTVLPGGQVLAKNEAITHDETFASTVTTFYIKSRMVLTNKRVMLHAPKIVLGFLPLGFTNKTLTMKQISGVELTRHYKIFRFLIGLFILFGGVTGGEASGVIGGLLVGGLIIMSSLQTHIEVSTSGEKTSLPIVFWHREKAMHIIAQINTALAERE
jgi:hypothetical protein